ncbi:hypothetical protein ACE1SV_55830 [Streptomyces sennicomposti]
MAQRRQPRRSDPAGSGAPAARGPALLSVVSLVSTVFLGARYIFLSEFTIAGPAARQEPCPAAGPASGRDRAAGAGFGPLGPVSGRRGRWAGVCADSAKVRDWGTRAVSHRFGR